jgi:hypothetical protein
MKYESVTVWQRCTRHIDVWEKIRCHTSKLRQFNRKQYKYFGFSKQSPLSKCSLITELSMLKIHLQIMVPDVGYNNFKKLEKEGEDQALHSKMLQSCIPQMTGGLFITAFTSTPTKCRLCRL